MTRLICHSQGLKSVIAVEQIKSVFDDNSRIIFCQFSKKNMLRVLIRITSLAEAILMSTHNICFHGELTKIILQLSSNTHLICSAVPKVGCSCNWATRYGNSIHLELFYECMYF